MTVLEQREAYAALEPFWSGALERSGEAPGLSAYSGRSSVYHSASWEAADAAEQRELKAAGFKRKTRGPGKGQRVSGRSKDAEIKAALLKGASYGAAERKFGVSASVVRRCARELGISRAQFSGSWRAK